MPETNTPQARPNRDIEQFMFSAGPVAIEQNFAMSELNQYLQDLHLLEKGVPYAELGISKRRASFVPTYMAIDGTVGAYELQSGNPIPVGSIAVLNLSGVMRSDGGISNPGIGQLVSELRAAYDNKNVLGVILETRSGGGEAIP